MRSFTINNISQKTLVVFFRKKKKMKPLIELKYEIIGSGKHELEIEENSDFLEIHQDIIIDDENQVNINNIDPIIINLNEIGSDGERLKSNSTILEITLMVERVNSKKTKESLEYTILDDQSKKDEALDGCSIM